VTKSLSDALSTHPPSEERVKQMEELAGKSPARGGTVNTADFTRARQLAAGLQKK
jgi:predicted Zn-dependent protease